MGINQVLIDENGSQYCTVGVKGGKSFRRWYSCDICGFDYPEDRVRKFRGKIYGIPCGCYKDIRGIIQKENP
jgi:hypothetical protein